MENQEDVEDFYGFNDELLALEIQRKKLEEKLKKRREIRRLQLELQQTSLLTHSSEYQSQEYGSTEYGDDADYEEETELKRSYRAPHKKRQPSSQEDASWQSAQ